jgi:hypothetical protein
MRAIALVLLLVACVVGVAALIVRSSTSSVMSHQCGVPVLDHVGFVDALRCDGFWAEPSGQTTIPSLRVPGTIVLVTDRRSARLSAPAELTSFWYGDTDLGGDARAVAQADARRFAPDGSLRDASQRVYYRGTPHLFLRARALVIYAGDDRAVLELLERILGPQFAGG